MKKEIIISSDYGDIIYYPEFFDKENSDAFLNSLLNEIEWESGTIKMFGKDVLQPRLFSWIADENVDYGYSGKRLIPKSWGKSLFLIKKEIESFAKMEFNSCLANLYRDGNDSMGWHSDDEKELGKNPVIVSVNFGVERQFEFKAKPNSGLDNQIIKIRLSHGSVLIMAGGTQHFYKHQVPKNKKLELKSRINLTFRQIKG